MWALSGRNWGDLVTQYVKKAEVLQEFLISNESSKHMAQAVEGKGLSHCC